MDRYDLAVIGGGPAGYTAALEAIKLKKTVVLIEEEALGGTCLNRGCIPTKTLLKTADLMEKIKGADAFALKTSGEVTFDLDALRERKTNVVNKLKEGLSQMLISSGIKIVKGRGTLKGKGVIQIQGESNSEVQADKIIIATGTREAVLPIEGHEHMMNSTNALELKFIPKSICIVGGGVIGVELATFYHGLGCKVQILEALSQILSNVDGEMAKLMRMELQKKEIDFSESCRVKKVEKTGDKYIVTYELDGEEHKLEADAVLNATGRKPNTESLGLENCGVKCSDKGFITVDANMETSAKGIYAAGDVNGGILLAHVAFHEGRVAAEHAFGVSRSDNTAHAVPQCIYTHPEMASVGMTEEQAKAKFKKLRKGYFSLAANGRALAAGDESGIVKVLTDNELGQIIGVHMIGEKATEVIGMALIAVDGEYTCDEFARLIVAHPTVCEAVKDAASSCIR